MVKCNVRTLSFISGAVQLFLSVIVGGLLVAVLAMKGSEEFKSELGTSRRLLRFIWYLIFATVVAFGSSILLFRAIKSNNIKIMSYSIWSVLVVIGVWTIVAIISLINNAKARGSFESAFVEFLIDMIYVFIEIVIVTPVSLLYKRLKAKRLNQMNQLEMQGLNRNGPYKPTCQS